VREISFFTLFKVNSTNFFPTSSGVNGIKKQKGKAVHRYNTFYSVLILATIYLVSSGRST
jgi:hypothetical protein